MPRNPSFLSLIFALRFPSCALLFSYRCLHRILLIVPSRNLFSKISDLSFLLLSLILKVLDLSSLFPDPSLQLSLPLLSLRKFLPQSN
jgi:hypothetical protein